MSGVNTIDFLPRPRIASGHSGMKQSRKHDPSEEIGHHMFCGIDRGFKGVRLARYGGNQIPITVGPLIGRLGICSTRRNQRDSPVAPFVICYMCVCKFSRERW